jgi:hypothetical protein
MTRRLFTFAALVLVVLAGVLVTEALAVVHTLNQLLSNTCGGPS